MGLQCPNQKCQRVAALGQEFVQFAWIKMRSKDVPESVPGGSIRRERECATCQTRFLTCEVVEHVFAK